MAATNSHCGKGPGLVTSVLPVDSSNISTAGSLSSTVSVDQDWSLNERDDSADAKAIRQAAKELRQSDDPVAFPTETVYGLGADVTRSSAIRGIFKAKQRPSDNPLIVHISSLHQLRFLLDPDTDNSSAKNSKSGRWADDRAPWPTSAQKKMRPDLDKADPIPVIYQALIYKFWPGPLTLIMPNPDPSILVPEVTAGLPTFGVRMPRNIIALTLIETADVPLAAPSANASSKPSPTTAAHVKHDLDGRISTILDGGPCEVGVESTVVDGLSDPPVVLRPGGISIDQLRTCPGWENVTIGYQDASQAESKPKAPGMKYKHYSPKAKVVLYESALAQPSIRDISMHGNRIGLIRTKAWKNPEALIADMSDKGSQVLAEQREVILDDSSTGAWLNGRREGEFFHHNSKSPRHGDENFHNQDDFSHYEHDRSYLSSKALKFEIKLDGIRDGFEIWDISLGSTSDRVARGLFSALRELDSEGVDTILVEGIDDSSGEVAAAVMNRLRKAAETATGV